MQNPVQFAHLDLESAEHSIRSVVFTADGRSYVKSSCASMIVEIFNNLPRLPFFGVSENVP